MHRLSIAVLSLALGALVVLNTNCMKCGENIAEKIAEEAVEAAGGGKVDIDARGTDMTDLPEFLRYPGVKAVNRVSITTAEGKGTVWSLESSDQIGNIVDWYRAAIKTQGWKTGAEMETGESTMLMGASEDDEESVTILLVWEEAKTTISLTHAKK